LCREHYNKQWKNSHKEEIKIYNKSYKENNKEQGAAYDKLYSETDHGRFTKAKTKAKQRGLEFSLTFEQFVEISNYICYYCEDGLCGRPSFQGAHLDRIDNNKGYTIDNVVSCGLLCNQIRMDNLTVQETRDAVNGILLGRLRREYPELLESTFK
jgi:hypothetical protein